MSDPLRRILIITRNFPPLWGGMERLNWHLAEQLARYAHVRVIAPYGARALAPPGVEVTETPLRPLSRFLLAAAAKALSEALRFRPDFVLAGSGLTAPLALTAAGLLRARAGAYTHGLDLTVDHPVYRGAWIPSIRRLDRVIVNSRNTAALARTAGVLASRLAVVHPGVTVPDLDDEARRRRRRAFREEHNLGERPVLLSVGRLTTRKGLLPFICEVLPRLVRTRPDCCLVIIGDAPKDALAAEVEQPEALLQAARHAGVEANLCWLGPRFGQALEAAYCAADVHVFPVREIPDDPEGFGMVAVEAAAHGLPTVAYAVGGVVDAVAEGRSGRLVAPGDAPAFANAVLQSLEDPLPSERVRAFAEQFVWPRFGERLWQALSDSTSPDDCDQPSRCGFKNQAYSGDRRTE